MTQAAIKTRLQGIADNLATGQFEQLYVGDAGAAVYRNHNNQLLFVVAGKKYGTSREAAKAFSTQVEKA